MNFDELSKIVAEEAGVDICPICGVPYKKRHPSQKTCATEECKRQWRRDYYKDNRKKRIKEDAEAFREYRREAMRKYRHKKRNVEIADGNLAKMQDYWERQSKRHVETDGIDYGKRQMERTLAQVPKIDVSGFGKERKENDNLHGKDTLARSRCDSEGRQDVHNAERTDADERPHTL